MPSQREAGPLHGCVNTICSKSLGGAPAGAETAGVVAEARRALLASARWLERAAEGAVSVGTRRATGSV